MRNAFLPVSIAMLSLSMAFTALAEPAQPNILLILVDDLGYPALSSFGNTDIQTPHIDALAEQGMKFDNAYACSQCTQTRVTLFSGQYPARINMTKVINSRHWPYMRMLTPKVVKRFPAETYTAFNMLQDAGYVTGMSGKWHVADGYSAAANLNRHGIAYFKRYGFDEVGAGDQNETPDKGVEALTDDCIAFIERNRDRPFFFYLSHFTVHTPLVAPQDTVNRHVQRGYPKTTTPWCDFNQRPTADYLAMLETLDNSVGRITRKLDELNLADNTIVIFTSDNGGLDRMASCAPLRGGKGMAYEGGIRVPMIVRWPNKISPGTTSSTPVHTVDYYPTFRAIAGGDARDHRLDGASFLPLLLGDTSLTRDTLYWHMPHYVPMYARTPCSVIRKGDWKLIHYFGDTFDPTGIVPENRKAAGVIVPGSRTELYNLADDPSETTDLAARHPDRVAELMAELEAFWEDTQAPMPELNPRYDPARWREEVRSAQR